MKLLLLTSALVILMLPISNAQRLTQGKNSEAVTSNPLTEHPYYRRLGLSGGIFEDLNSPACRRGYIGWAPTGTSSEIMLVLIQEAFRNVKLDCDKDNLPEAVSCLFDNHITRWQSSGDEAYRVDLRLVKDPQGRDVILLKEFSLDTKDPTPKTLTDFSKKPDLRECRYRRAT